MMEASCDGRWSETDRAREIKYYRLPGGMMETGIAVFRGKEIRKTIQIMSGGLSLWM